MSGILSGMSRRLRVVALVVAPLVPLGCGHAASNSTPRTVTAAFTLAHERVVVSTGTHVVVRMSYGEATPPQSSDPRVLAPTASASEFVARRAGTATINGQLPCRGTACTAMRSWITVVVRG
jgi:hypothetical protein